MIFMPTTFTRSCTFLSPGLEIKRTIFYTFFSGLVLIFSFDHIAALFYVPAEISWDNFMDAHFPSLCVRFHLANALILLGLWPAVSFHRFSAVFVVRWLNITFNLCSDAHLFTFATFLVLPCHVAIGGWSKTKDLEWNNNLTGLECELEKTDESVGFLLLNVT